MPTTQAIRDGNEMYYMTNGRYADAVSDMDVKTTNTEDMEIEVGDETETPDFSYVMATRPDISNNLIMYQKHSSKFADNVHCEALKENSQAQWLCETALHGEYIDGSLNENYDTYVLSGTLGENDYFPKECEESGEQTCSCGGPIVGTCNDKTGNWVYSAECPTPNTLESPRPCGTGFTGNEVHKVKCNSAGTAYEYYWDRGGCTAISTWYSTAQDYGNTIKEAQEAYYAQHGQYASSLSALGLQNLQCPSGASSCTMNVRGVDVNYQVNGQNAYTIVTVYENSTNALHAYGSYCWGSSWSGFSGIPRSRCAEAGYTVNISGDSFVRATN